ncbi:hypothetical protein GQ55_4G073800 [Panicum hallii var. hallii]|uniref:Uncharacterized protein n=1 Tax=Panicum hallii var. hallii TaxID=1504633 RepID=A0A2T7DW56_9POAL|nr:hypothetical protein GQ55_4G073800 [Panicum hallii var. hallii]
MRQRFEYYLRDWRMLRLRGMGGPQKLNAHVSIWHAYYPL